MLKKEIFKCFIPVSSHNLFFLKTDIFDVFIKKSFSKDISITITTNISNVELLEKDLSMFLKTDDYIKYELNEIDLIKAYHLNELPKIDIDINIPEGIKLHLETIHSTIKINDISNEFKIMSNDGDIFITNAGHGYVESCNGSMVLINTFDNFDIKTINGEIYIVNGNGGVVNANSTNGIIKLKKLNYNKIIAKSENSNISFDMNKGRADFVELISINGEIKFSTDNNNFNSVLLKTNQQNIKIFVPDELYINLDLATNKGFLNAEIDTENAFESIIDTERFYANFGEDLPSIKAIVENGNITVLDYFKHKKDLFDDTSDVHINNNKNETTVEYINKDGIRIKETAEIIEDSYIIEDDIDTSQSNDWLLYIKSFFKNKIPNYYQSFKSLISNKLKKKDKSVLKILELLENKSISVEEAERLIKIITKE